MDENNSSRETTVSRRDVLAATGTGSAALVAGCSGGDSTGTDGPATETATSSVPGTVSSDVAELYIVEHQPDLDYFDENDVGEDDQQQFPVDLTVENSGDQQTDAMAYEYDLTPYHADCWRCFAAPPLNCPRNSLTRCRAPR